MDAVHKKATRACTQNSSLNRSFALSVSALLLGAENGPRTGSRSSIALIAAARKNTGLKVMHEHKGQGGNEKS
jgi:hypothetical protein